MRRLWLDHCLRLSSDLGRTLNCISCPDIDELKSRMQIKLSRDEFNQLRAELQGMQQYLRPGAVQNPDKIFLLGVAFVPDSDEDIRDLRLKLEHAERRRMAVENIIGMGDRIARNRRGVGRGVHVPQTHQPGTHRGRSS